MSDLWLKWNNQLELLNSLDHLLERECFVDVTIAVEGQVLKAHRIVLCASSWYFNSILKSNTSQHPIIFMRDVKLVEMKAILDFIYKGEAYVTQENIQGVLKTAEALKITGLSNISWTESSVNYMQEDEASQCQTTTILQDSLIAENVDKEVDDEKHVLPLPNDNSLSSSEIGYQSKEDTNENRTEQDLKVITDSLKDTNKLTDVTLHEEQSKLQNCKAEKVAHMSASEDGETFMILEAPSSVSINSVPTMCMKSKSIGRQYTKEDLQHALEMIRRGQMGIKPAARAFNIPVATLHHAARRSKISSPMQQGGNHMISYRNKVKHTMSAKWSPETSNS